MQMVQSRQQGAMRVGRKRVFHGHTGRLIYGLLISGGLCCALLPVISAGRTLVLREGNRKYTVRPPHASFGGQSLVYTRKNSGLFAGDPDGGVGGRAVYFGKTLAW
jgi:hypothetical protein